MNLQLLSSTLKDCTVTTSCYRNAQDRRINCAHYFYFFFQNPSPDAPNHRGSKDTSPITSQLRESGTSFCIANQPPYRKQGMNRERTGNEQGTNVDGNFPSWNLFCSLRVDRLLWPLQMKCPIILSQTFVGAQIRHYPYVGTGDLDPRPTCF